MPVQVSMLASRVLNPTRELKPVAKSDGAPLPAVAAAARTAGLSAADAGSLDVIARAWLHTGKPITPPGAIPTSLFSGSLLDRVYPAFGVMQVEPARSLQRALLAAAVPVAKADIPLATITYGPAPARLPALPAAMLGSSMGVRSTSTSARTAPPATSLAATMGVRTASAPRAAEKADAQPPARPAPSPVPARKADAAMDELRAQMAALKSATETMTAKSDALAAKAGIAAMAQPATKADSAVLVAKSDGPVRTINSRPLATTPTERMTAKSDDNGLVPTRLPAAKAWRLT